MRGETSDRPMGRRIGTEHLGGEVSYASIHIAKAFLPTESECSPSSS